MPSFLPGHHGTSFHSCLSPSMLCLVLRMGFPTLLRAGVLLDLDLMFKIQLWFDFFSVNLAGINPGHWVSTRKLPSTWLGKSSLVVFWKGYWRRQFCLPGRLMSWTWRLTIVTWRQLACSFSAAFLKKVHSWYSWNLKPMLASSCLQVGQPHGRAHYQQHEHWQKHPCPWVVSENHGPEPFWGGKLWVAYSKENKSSSFQIHSASKVVFFCFFAFLFLCCLNVKLGMRYCKKQKLATALQAWKSGDHFWRPYEPNPGEVGPSVKLADFVFKLVQVEVVDPKAKSFDSKYKLSLPTAVRSRRLNLQVAQNIWFHDVLDTTYVQVC